ncbi:13672_t:CDS:2, partial [Funneliformis geosporum]
HTDHEATNTSQDSERNLGVSSASNTCPNTTIFSTPVHPNTTVSSPVHQNTMGSPPEHQNTTVLSPAHPNTTVSSPTTILETNISVITETAINASDTLQDIM